jgi:diadenosine tetraphosphate (Ap4A) HIT family hydrolase
MKTDPDCLFCKFVSGELPCHKVWEDERHIAFLTIFPNTEAFTVVATKEHLDSYAFNNDDAVISDLVIASKKVARMIDRAYADDVERTGLFFEGYGVDHLHAKLFPMHGTAKYRAGWRPIDSDVMDMVFPEYPGYLCSNNGPRVPDEELARVAEKIRAAAE